MPWQDVDGVEASALGVSFVNARTEEDRRRLFGVPEGSFLASRPDAQQALSACLDWS